MISVSNEKGNDKSKSKKSKSKKEKIKEENVIVEPKPLVKRILKSSNKLEHVPGSGSHVEFKTATLSKKEKAALA